MVKNKEGELPDEADLKDFDITSVSCNGQYVIIHKNYNSRSLIFRLSDGVKVGESTYTTPAEKFKSTYDYTNNIVYNISLETSQPVIESIQITNFKKANVSSGFAKDFMDSRI